MPVFPRDAGVERLTRDSNRGVVLLTAVHPVGKLVVGIDPIELGGRLVLLRRPGPAAVVRDVRPPIVRINNDVRVLGVYPEVVVVPVRHADVLERLPAIDRLQQIGVRNPDHVGILRIGEDFDVVPGARANAPGLVHDLPGLARVFRTIESALRVRLHQRVDPLGVRGDGNAQLAFQLGEAVIELHPRVTRVRRLVDSASRTAAPHLPWGPPVIPERGVENARIFRIHREIGRARVG